MSSSEEESLEHFADDSNDPGDTFGDNQEQMSLEDKLQHLKQLYPDFPQLMIKKVLQRVDVGENIDIAIKHLDEIKGLPNKNEGVVRAQECPQGGVDKKIKSLMNEQDVPTTHQPETFVDKEKYLKGLFKNVPPFIIRKVLQNPEVNGDIEVAKERLIEKSASSKPTFNVGGDQNQRGRRGGPGGRGRGHGWGNRGKQCWTAETSQNPETPQSQSLTPQNENDSSSSFEGQHPSAPYRQESQSEPFKEECNKNQGNKNRNRNRNRNRNKKQQNRGQGKQGDKWNQARPFPHCGYNMSNEYNSMPHGGQVPYYGQPQFGNPPFMPPPQPYMNVWTGPNSGFYQGFQQRNNNGRNNSHNRGMQRGRGNMHLPFYPQPPLNTMNMGGDDLAQGFNGPNNGHDNHQEKQTCGSDKDAPKKQPLEPNTISLHGLNETITEEYITNYIEARTREDVMQVTFSDDHKCAIISLRKLSDFNKAQQRVAEKPLEGLPVNIKRLPLCSSIMVTGLLPKTTKDGVEFYFSHKKRGGDVQDVSREDDHAIVTFEDHKVVNKALNPDKPHELDGMPITVSKYYPFMYKDTSKKLPGKDDIPVGVDSDIMSFITSTKDIKNALESKLQQLKFTLRYNTGENIAYIVETGTMASKEKGIEAVMNFVRKFTTFKLNVNSQLKELIMADLYELQQSLGREKVHLVEKEDYVLVVCREDNVEELKKKFQEQIEETQLSENKKLFDTQEIETEEEKLQLLKKFDFFNNYLSKEQYPDLEVELDEDAFQIRLVGPKKEVSKAKVTLYRTFANMRDRQLSLTHTVIKMLSSERGMTRITALLEEENIEALFWVDESDSNNPVTAVIGMSVKDATRAVELITKRTSEIKIKVDKDNREVVKSPKWVNFCEQLEGTYNVHIHRSKYMDTWVAGFDDDVAKAHDQMKQFLDQNSLRTEAFCCQDDGVRRYLVEKRKEELNGIASDLAQYSVEIKPGQESSKLQIYGSKIGTDQAREAIHNLIDTITTKDVKIEQPGLNKLYTRGVGDRIVKSVEQEHHCIIMPSAAGKASRTASPTSRSDSDKDVHGAHAMQDGVDESSDDSDDDMTFLQGGPAVPTISGSSAMYGNVKVSWKAGDIVNENADVLVSSILGQLAKAFNVPKTLFGNLAQGNIQTSAKWGNLPCIHVILTHIINYGNAGATQVLQTTVQKCLQEAIQLNAQSIAFPILGTTGLGFPADLACRLMINEVINVVNGWRGLNSVNDVRFVVHFQDQQLVTTFQQEFNSITNGTGNPSFIPANPGNSVFPGNSGLPGNGVSVVPGDLVQATSDAIVNIINTDLDLNNSGQLSAKIAATYPLVQHELSGLGQQREGAVVITSNGRNILHAVCQQVSQQNAQTAIENCLKAADRHGFTSISVPSFGTGKSNLTAQQSAQAAFTAISNVQLQLNVLQNIQIVIYNDQTMLNTFQQVQQQHGFSAGSGKLQRRTGSTKKPTPAPRQLGKVATLPKQSSSRVFTIYGKSNNNVESASTDLIKSFAEFCKTDTFSSETVSKLSVRQRRLLREKANKLDVTIKFEDRAERIVIRGNSEDLTAIMKDIMIEIQERTKKETDSEQAKVLYKTIQWQYELNGQTVSFRKAVNAVIEKAYANKDGNVTVEILNQKVVIDLVNNTFQEPSTGRAGTVTRTHVGVSNSGDIAFPKEWSPMPTMNGKEVSVHLVILTPGSNEYQHVSNQFFSTGGSGTIDKIERVQNPHLYEQYMVRKKKMDKENVGIKNERELFHGTASQNVNDINKTNFNRSFSGKAHGTAYGNGVYFARDASYSMGYSNSSGYGGQRHMYLARVLVGEYTPGSSGMIVPPVNPNTGNNYDSVSGHGGSIFVVFYDSQCYPAYLITFR